MTTACGAALCPLLCFSVTTDVLCCSVSICVCVCVCVQGGESQVIAKYYTIAYKQVYDDEAGESDWKIVDYHMDGSDQYY